MLFCAQSVLADYKDMLLQIFRYYAAGEKVSCMAAAALLPTSCLISCIIGALGATIANAKSLLQIFARGQAAL